MKNIILTTLFLILSVAVSYAGDVTYRKDIRPIFEAKCASCHGPDSPDYHLFKEDKKHFTDLSKGPRMDDYANLIYFVGWPDTGALMRRLDDGSNTGDGTPGNMYVYLGATENERQENLSLFRKWTGNWNLKRWKEVSKEEMEALIIKY